eukprot:12703474-Alexandrium_andersonii.AAC.1
MATHQISASGLTREVVVPTCTCSRDAAHGELPVLVAVTGTVAITTLEMMVQHNSCDGLSGCRPDRGLCVCSMLL